MKTILYLLTAALLCGCVSVGRKIDQAKVEQIKTGETSRAQVLQLIGSPDQITSTGNGVVMFRYIFVHATPKASTFIPVVGAFAGGAHVQNEMVMVTFTNNVVRDIMSSYGGNETGTGANAASTADLPAVQTGKRPK
jgi:outer membrane protein assembly factor BamE (lipoprotein component of BamABCDE complex)